MNLHPAKLELDPDGRLVIQWSDQRSRSYSVKELRDRCPCATCREKREEEAASPPLLPVLSIEEAKPLTLVEMKPIGNYAYGIQFSDGHDTGIFTFELLRELGAEVG